MTAGAPVGLIVPSSNPVIELFAHYPPVSALLGLRVLVTRVRVQRIAADADSGAQFNETALSSAASLLADAEVPLICWAGTSGFWLGGDKEDEVLARVSDRAGGVPVTSSRIAVLDALAERPAAAAGVLTPYVPEVHAKVVSAVAGAVGQARGTVVADRGLGLERNLDFAAIPPPVIAAELHGLAARGADTVAVVCTNLPAVLPALADAPFLVVDSVLATLWHAARLSGGSTASYARCYRQACARLAGSGGMR